MFDLTNDQNKAINMISKWYNNPLGNFNKVFIVSGNAGTGKTTLLKYLINHLNIENNVALASFTGKSSIVIQEKVGITASTIHKLIYNIQKIKDGKIKFILKKRHELENIKLIIIDESSMVSTELFEDLLSYNIKIIMIGDRNQLPAIGESESLFQKSNVHLSEITRTSKDNPIIYLSQRIIHNQPIKYGNYGNGVVVVPHIRGKEELLLKADQVLCSKNIHRNKLNKQIRLLQGIKDEFPIKGDKIICRKNNWDKYLEESSVFELNGTIGTITSDVQQERHTYWDNRFNRSRFDDIFKFDFKPYSVNTSEVFQDVKVDYDNIMLGKNEFGSIHSDKQVSIYNFGSAITIHSCLTDDCFIFTNNGIKQLKDLNNDAKINQFKKLDCDIMVYNGTKLEKPLAFYNNGVTNGFEIKTSINGSIKCSDTHKFKIINDDGYIEEILSQDLKVDDQLLINKKNDVYGDIIKLNDDIIKPITGNVRMKEYDLPIEMSNEFAKLLGLIVADGTIRYSGLHLMKRHKDVVEFFVESVYNIFGYKNKNTINKCSDRNAHIAYINSNFIFRFLNRIGGLKPNNKFVPDCIMNTTKEFQQSFLSGIFEDGSVAVKNNKFNGIELSMCVEKTIDQVRMILLNMGIISTKKHYKKNLYSLYIYGKSAYKFYKNIGFISKFKNDRLKLIDSDIKHNERKTYKNLPKIIKILLKRHSVKYHQWLQQVIKRNKITENKLEQFLLFFENIMKNDDDYKYLKYVYEYLATDNIISIDRMKLQTYSIEMPITHDFVQNGYLGKNSQGSEWNKTLVYGNELFGDESNRKKLLYTAVTRSSSKMILVLNS